VVAHGWPTAGRTRVNSPAEERTYWNAQATLDPLAAAWSDDDLIEGLVFCMRMLHDTFRPTLRHPNHHLLDLGCGGGRLLIPMAREYPKTMFTGIDISPVMINEAMRQRTSHDLTNATLLLGDGRTLPLELSPITGGWSILLFQHLDDDTVASYLRGLSAQAQSGSLFLFQFVDAAEESSHGPFSHPRSLKAFRNLCVDAGLRVEDTSAGIVRESWIWMRCRTI